MSFPFLPVNPNCGGCSPSSSSLGCNDPCKKYKHTTDEIVYNGPDLVNIGVKTCDSLTVIIQKINEAISGGFTTTSTTTITPTTSSTTSTTTFPITTTTSTSTQVPTTSTSTTASPTTTSTSTTLVPTTTSTTTEEPILAWYFGVLNVPGGIVEIPDAGDIDMSTGTEVTDQNANNPIDIPFNSSTTDFLWFAIPEEILIKTHWFITIFNQGDIGGEASSFGNLFPYPVIKNYLGVNYYLYISNYRTNIATVLISGAASPTTSTTSTTGLLTTTTSTTTGSPITTTTSTTLFPPTTTTSTTVEGFPFVLPLTLS